ncbi:MAG: hypothetical protein VYE15_01585, partial [Myxococcota bacterium]|nr:hypothetical protein [Myxococcota bacterium]
NVLGGAFSPVISPDGRTMVYVGWTAKGEDLYSLPFRPEEGVGVVVADTRPPLIAEAPQAVPDLVQRDYESLPTLLPRSWAPSLVASSQGLSTVGMALTGLDASRRVGTALAAEWNAARRTLAATAELDLGTGWSDIRWLAGRYVSDQPQSAGDRVTLVPQEILFTTLGVSTRFPAPVTSSRIGASLIAALHRDVGGPLQPAHAPDAAEAVIPADGLRTSVKLSWSFNDVRRHPYSISVADGVSGGLSLRLTSPQPARPGLLNHQLRYHLRTYGALPWLEDHVIALIIRGGWSGGAESEGEPFRLGDTPTQDLVSTLMQEVQTGSHWLRGYPGNTLTGSSFHLLTTEYRLPLGRIRRGLETLPIFARDLSMAVFHDLGVAYTDPLDAALFQSRARGSVGAEVRLTTDLFFALPLRIRFGWARGWGIGGGHQGYLVLAADP